MQTRCIILAGGLGTRLAGTLGGLPKCLAPVQGKPFLYWQMSELKNLGISEFTLALGYGAALVVDELQRWVSEFGDVDWVVEAEPMGTGGALCSVMAANKIEEAIVINGDTMLSGNISPILAPLNISNGEIVRIGMVCVDDRQRFGGIESNAIGQVVCLLEKRIGGYGMINAGLYRISSAAFKGEQSKKFSFENSTLQRLCLQMQLYAVALDCNFIDIGVPSDYLKFCRKVA